MKNLEERLAALSPEQRALLESRLKQKGLNEETLAAARAQGIRPIPNRESLPYLPISLDQERLWFIDQMEPGNPAYNIHTSTRMVGPMDAGRMERAINLSIARHEGLRVTFQVVDDRPVAVVTPRLEIALEPIDLTHVPAEEKDEAARVASVEYHRRRFDLAQGPLVRAALLKLAPEDQVLLICMHHAVTDRWSFDVFEAEVGANYVALGQGRQAELPHLPIHYADFAAWQRAELSGQRLERHLAYWKEKLSGAPLVLEVPTDRPRPAVQTFTGGREYIIYSEELLHALKTLTQKAGATMFMTALAALDILCWKYSGQRDLLIGSAIADRNRTETENVIGYFLNMLLLRGTIDPAMSFRQFLAQVKETAHGAVAHQEVPFATLVDLLGVKQDPSRNPLMQVSYIYLDFPITATPEYAGFSASSIDVDNGASRFDLTLACTEVPGLGLHTYFEYNGDLYDPPKVARMLAHLGRILEFAVAHPDRPLSELELLTDAERGELATLGPTERFDWALLHGRIEDAARRHAEAVALTIDGRSLTYAELAAARDRVATALAARGIGPGSLVPIAAERSVAQVAAILGVLQAGTAYVPLDLTLPEARLASMLRDMAALDRGPRVVLRQARLTPPAAAGESLVLEELLASNVDAFSAQRDAHPDDLAYVMFTSGSTGEPKGVMVSHRAIANRVAWSNARYPITSRDTALHSASFGFDIAAFELIAPLSAGARVILPREGEHKDPAALLRLLREERVTVAHFVPSLLRALLDESGFAGLDESGFAGLDESGFAGLDALRLVFTGGEGLDRETHDRMRRALPHVELVHLYGPTEAAISSLAFDCSRELPPGAVPIGAPIANTRAVLLDETLKLVPKGVPGEVYLGGDCLARGYLTRPELTAPRFVPDPISDQSGARLYRTGDLARYREDGAIEFLGRVDHQVKIRGQRIELAEIDLAMSRLPGVRESVTVAPGEGAEKRLVTYWCARDEAPTEVEIKNALKRSLPEAMVPSLFVLLPTLPRNVNGKIDRRALPEPGASISERVYVAPRTPIEARVIAIWEGLLKRSGIGAEDDFFELGGNSLLATQVVSRLRSSYEIELPLRRFFEGSNVAALADAVEEALVVRLEAMSEEEASALLARLERS